MPRILYAWTSAPGSLPPPKKIFTRGDSIQFNVIHQPEIDLDNQVDESQGNYVVTYFHELLGLYGLSNDEHNVELLWPIKLNYNSPLLPYSSSLVHDYRSMVIPTGVTSIRPDNREEFLEILQTFGHLIKVPGYWRFTAFVAATDQNNQWNFDVMDCVYHLRENEWWPYR